METPQKGLRANRKSKLEFTPILDGRNIHRSPEHSGMGDSKHSTSINRRQPMHSINGSIADSSFDHTSNNFDATLESMKLPDFPKTETTIPQRTYGIDNIAGGMNSIKEQQMDLKKLHSENYNLKIKLATLTRFFSQTPEEQRELLDENVVLKQQIFHSTEEVRRLNDIILSLEYQTDKENRRLPLLAEDNNKKALNEKDKMLSEFQRRTQALERELEITLREKQNSGHFVEEVHDLRQRNKSLETEVDKLCQTVHYLEDLKRLEKNGVGKVEEELGQYKSRIESLCKELEASRSKSARLESQYLSLSSSSKTDAGQNRDTISQLKVRMHEMEENYEREKLVLREKQANIDHLQDEIDIKSRSLESFSRKLEQSNHELEDKDEEILSLRKKIETILSRQSSSKEEEHQFYQSEIGSLRKRESDLLDYIRTLKNEVTDLQDKMYEVNSSTGKNDKRLNQLKKANDELQDKLEFYESEYAILEKGYNNAEKELRSLKDEVEKATQKIMKLQQENRSLIDRLKVKATSSSESALGKSEDLSRARLESEKNDLLEECESLRVDLKKLSRQLESERTNKEVVDLEFDNQKLTSECHHLKRLADETLAKRKDLESRGRRLETLLEEKESTIESLEARVREIERTRKMRAFTEDEEKTELFKIKSSNESKIRILEMDLENAKKEFVSQLDYYKKKVDILSRQEEIYKKQLSQLSESKEALMSPVVLLLEKQLEDSEKTRIELSTKVNDIISSNEELKQKYGRIQERNDQLIELTNAFEKNEKYAKLENHELEMKIKSLTKELDRVNSRCSGLVEKLQDARVNNITMSNTKGNDIWINKVRDLKSENLNLSQEIDNLSRRLSSTQITNTSLSSGKTSLLEKELHYYKAKLFSINLRANDFELMYNFTINSIKNSNRIIQNDILKLKQCGVYPDYTAMNFNKLQNGGFMTFKAVAQFVLAAVRIKRRTEKSLKRTQKLFEMKNEIEIDRLTLQ